MLAKVVTREVAMLSVRSESSSVSTTAGKAARACSAMSPPSNVRDCSRMERVTFPANESIATSAATPNAMDDMYSASRRRAVRLSRQASRSSACVVMRRTNRRTVRRPARG